MTGPDAPRSRVRSRSKNAAHPSAMRADAYVPRRKRKRRPGGRAGVPYLARGWRGILPHLAEGLLGGGGAASCEHHRTIEQAIRQTVVDDGYHHRQRWTSASSPRSSPSPTRAASRRPPGRCTPCSRTCPPTSPASSGSSGVTLVDRASGVLTEEGEAVVGRARRIQAELEALVADVAALRDEVSGTVRLGCIGTSARWLVPLVLEAVDGAAPEGPRDRGRRHHHLAGAPAPRRRARPRRRQPARRRPRGRRPSPSSTRTASSSRPTDHPLAARDACRWPTWPTTRCCSSRAAPRSATSSTARRPRPASSCRPRPRSTGCASSPRSPSRASAPPSCRPPPRPPGSRASWRRVPIDGLGAALGRPGPAPAGAALGAGPRPPRRGHRRRGRRRRGLRRRAPGRHVTARPRRRVAAPTCPRPSPSPSDHPGSLSAQITIGGRAGGGPGRDLRRAPARRAVRGRRPHLRGGRRARPGRRAPAAGHHRLERRRRERRRGRPARLGHGGPGAGPLLGPRARAASPPPDPSCPARRCSSAWPTRS